MDANNDLDHTPPTSWDCYTSIGAEAAGGSNIATTPGVEAVDLYMVDPGAGNAGSIGHRRWIIGNWVGPVGLGSTVDYSCLYVNAGNDQGIEWAAFPSEGPFPIEAIDTLSWGTDTVDTVGWTFQSDDIDLGSATVTVTAGGVNKSVNVSQLNDWYGSQYAIKFIPNGWTSQAGTTYTVTIGNIGSSISYDVEMVDCE